MAALLLAGAAHAQPPEPMQSVNFYAHGPCNGQDDVANNIYPPWQNEPVMIVGVELTIFFSDSANPALQYAFAGNSVTPDVMAWMGPGESHASRSYPSGYGMLFGPIGLNPHVDMHVNCIGGGKYQGFETIYYVTR